MNLCRKHCSRKLMFYFVSFYSSDVVGTALVGLVCCSFVKGALSRILAKFRDGEWPLNSVKYKNNHGITKSEEDGNGFRYGFLKYCWAKQFSKLITLACNFKL